MEALRFPNTVLVNVGRENRAVTLSDDQMTQWQEAKKYYNSKVDWIKRSRVPGL